MRSLRSFRRHLSPANVIATVALFLALGGGAYAATGGKINGNKIVNRSIAARKLKDGTITSRQIKLGSLTANLFDVSSFGAVPSAQTAQSAVTATSATRATTATFATNAGHATTADSATTAASAQSAKVADSATSATNADHAKTADDATTIGGKALEDLSKDFTLACGAGTEAYGGVCWSLGESEGNWFKASEVCGNLGGRLPTLSELYAYIVHTKLVDPQTWSSEFEVEGGKQLALTSEESTAAKQAPATQLVFYRCVFNPTN